MAMTNKWAIVTGGSSGIGLAISIELARRGYDLMLVARNQERLERARERIQREQERRVQVIALDLAREGACEELVRIAESHGIRPEVLVNNAGIGHHGDFLGHSSESHQACIDLNLSATVRLSRAYAELMVMQGSGYLLHVGSVSGFAPLPGYSVYAATKAFVASFSRALNYELRATGVSSTVLCPGYTETNFFETAGHSINGFVRRVLSQADDVARQGVDAMLKRKTICVPGLANRLMAFLTRLTPSGVVTEIAARINSRPRSGTRTAGSRAVPAK